MPRKSLKKRGKPLEQNAFEFTGEEADQADKEAKARPTLKRQKISILSTLPDATQRLAALAKKPFLCTLTDEPHDDQKVPPENKREAKSRFGRRSASYHGPKSQSNNVGLETQNVIKRRTRHSMKSRASTESVVTPPIKREVTPDSPAVQASTQDSNETSSAPRRSGRKRFRTTKAYQAYEDARKHFGSKKRVRTSEQQEVRDKRTSPEQKTAQKGKAVQTTSKDKKPQGSEGTKKVEFVPVEVVNDEPKTIVGVQDGENSIPQVKHIQQSGSAESNMTAMETGTKTETNHASGSWRGEGPDAHAAVNPKRSVGTFTDTHQRPSSIDGTTHDSDNAVHEKGTTPLKKSNGIEEDQQQDSDTSDAVTHGTAVINKGSSTGFGRGSDLPKSKDSTDKQEQTGPSHILLDVKDHESEPGEVAKNCKRGTDEADTNLERSRSNTDLHTEHQSAIQDRLLESPVTPVNHAKDAAEFVKADVAMLNSATKDSVKNDGERVSTVTDVNRGGKQTLQPRKMELRDSKQDNNGQESGYSLKEDSEKRGSKYLSSLREDERDGEKKILTLMDKNTSNTKDTSVHRSSLQISNPRIAKTSEGSSDKPEPVLPLTRQLESDRSLFGRDIHRPQVNTVIPEIVTEVLESCTSPVKKDAISEEAEILARRHAENSAVLDSEIPADRSAHAHQQNSESQDPSPKRIRPSAKDETCIKPTGPSSLNSGGKQQITDAHVPFKTAPDETLRSPPKLQAAMQNLEKSKQTFSKRVRFIEPDTSTLRRNGRRDLSGILKMRMRKGRRRQASLIDRTDVSVMTGHATEPNEKDERVLLDELQYVLDGIFKPSGSSGKKSPQLESQLIAKSLVSLISLLKRKPRRKMFKEGGEHESAMIQILVKQPSLFKTIVGKLCSVFGKSRSVDAVLAVVFVIIFRETPKLRLIEAPELDILLNAFFRSSAAALKDDDVGNTSKSLSKEGAAPEGRRRRGRLAKRLEETKTDDTCLSTLNKVVSDANILEEEFEGFKGETVAAAHLIGIAISLILCFDSKLRTWMRENRRLDRVVAVLYSCEKVMIQKISPGSEQRPLQFTSKEVTTPWIVLGASLRVLEFTVLDEVCQSRTARESRLCAIVVDVIRSVKELNEGPFGGEWILSSALRVGINLCHGFREASRQFVEKGGHELALMWVVKECNAANLITSGAEELEEDDCEQCFDVRVLCLALLATIVDQEKDVCNMFHTMNVPGLKNRKAGGLEIVLEILQAAEALVEKADEESMANNNISELNPRRSDIQTDEQSERSELLMETKITIGYASLLVGALVRVNEENRKIAEELIPSHNLVGVAAVLTGFLEFHHEVGIISGSMDRMYARIINSLVKPFQTADPAHLAGDVRRLSDADEGDTTTNEQHGLDSGAQVTS